VRQTHCFIQAQGNIHVLHRLTRRALDEIVYDRQHYYLIAPLGPMHRQPTDIGAAHAAGFRMTTGRHDVDKGFIGITLFVQCLQVGIRSGERGVKRRVNPANHGRQMGHEGQANAPPQPRA